MILRVGLTGGIASGKSTARALFAELGAYAIDADKLVAELYEPGRAGHAALVATYGEQILRDDQTIDRVKLANIAFAHPDEAKKLNALIHPIVRQYTAELIENYARTHDEGIVVVEATLLLEDGGDKRWDRIVIVDVDPDVQIARGIARGLTREEVTRRIANQMSRDTRLSYAHYVIDNSGDRAQLEREVRRVWDALQAEMKQKERQA